MGDGEGSLPASSDVGDGEGSQPASSNVRYTEGNLPASFDLRDGDGPCYVTPVKLQNPFGACWGFAAISAAETSLLGSHLADDPKAHETLNLSEKQLACFAHTFIDDPSNSQNGEGSWSYKYQMENGEPTLTEPLVSGD